MEGDQPVQRIYPTVFLGACESLGLITPIPAWVWRTLFACGLLYWGLGFGIYVIVAFCLPTPAELLREH